MLGVDISTFQKKVDFKKLKDSGIEFVIIRCGYGKEKNQKDVMFESHYEGAKKVGLKVGAYLYSYVTSVENARKEAYNCLEFIKGKNFDMPIFYDLEDKITECIGAVTITECAKEFIKILQESGYDSRSICKFKLV